MTFEYAPAPESRSIVSIKPKYGHFINGSFVAGKKHFPTINPATEEILSHIALGGVSDVDKAVMAAQKAYTKTWSKLSGKERGKYLYRIARILQERAREFAVLETLDNGKPIRETRDIDIPLVAAHFFYHAGWADKLDYAGLGHSPKAYGVAGQIIPWNFPLLMLAWKVAPALATGNTVVLKPAETTSLTALLFAEVCQQAELPDGVVNIVTGDGSTGATLVNHPGVHKIAFTGSTEVGRIIARQVAGSNKKVTLELGGKAANVTWIVSDITEFQPTTSYDFWHDRAAFHFLTTEPQIVKYLSTTRQAVKENGFVTIGTFSTDGPKKCSGLDIKQYTEDTLTAELKNGFKKVKCIIEDHTTPFDTKQNFLFCNFKRTEHLNNHPLPLN